MNKCHLIYSMQMSVDGYVEDEHGRFDFTTPDEEVNLYINELTSSVGTYLYGRRMYESMVFGIMRTRFSSARRSWPDP